MDINKAVQRIETNLARDDGVNIHTRDIEIQDKDVEVGPLGFTGLSGTPRSLSMGFFHRVTVPVTVFYRELVI